MKNNFIIHQRTWYDNNFTGMIKRIEVTEYADRRQETILTLMYEGRTFTKVIHSHFWWWITLRLAKKFFKTSHSNFNKERFTEKLVAPNK